MCSYACWTQYTDARRVIQDVRTLQGSYIGMHLVNVTCGEINTRLTTLTHHFFHLPVCYLCAYLGNLLAPSYMPAHALILATYVPSHTHTDYQTGLKVAGTIPVNIGGTVYNIPIAFVMDKRHPYIAPKVSHTFSPPQPDHHESWVFARTWMYADHSRECSYFGERWRA